MHRRLIRALPLLLAIPFAAVAQEVQLRGSFVLMRAPAADTRPPVGEARAVVNEDGDVRVDLVVSGVTERVTSATLHSGTAGENTEQVARLDVVANGDEARIIGGRAGLTPIVAQLVRSGAAYILLRTSEHPDGFLRAQLARQPRTLGSVTNAP